MRAFKSGIIGLMMLASAGASALAGEVLGGHDGGGASSLKSTPEEVREVVQWAYDEARFDKAIPSGEENWFKSVMHFTNGPAHPRSPKGMPVMTCLLFGGAQCISEDFDRALERDEKLYSSFAQLVGDSPLVFEEKGPCPAADKDDAAASVSAYRPGATLCFSIPLLQQTPRSALKAQVVALLAHEATHLAGLDESIAVQIQKGVFDAYNKLFVENYYAGDYRFLGPVMRLKSGLFNLRAAGSSTAENLANAKYGIGWLVGTLETIVDNMPDPQFERNIPGVNFEMRDPLVKKLNAIKDKVMNLGVRMEALPDEAFDLELTALMVEADDAMLLTEQFLGRK